jgi:nucleotide-binding universal stress UspA family protein
MARDGKPRILVATDHKRVPCAALKLARAVAGQRGEIVLATVLVVPVTQPLEANLDRSVDRACSVLEQAEDLGEGELDTRLVRARSFAKGVLETLAAEPFDFVMLEREPGPARNGTLAQLEALVEKAGPTVVVVRP